MKCKYCFKNGKHYHEKQQKCKKNHGPVMNMKTMCSICAANKGKKHFHF